MLRSKNRLGANGTTLGVIVDWLGDPYQATLCAGIEQGASNAGANLLFFVGGTLPASIRGARSPHHVYQLAGPHNLDGLVVLSSTLSHEVGIVGVREFCTQFAGLPLCSVGLPLPDAPSVTVDNEAGMAELVRHLVTRHERKRIAFISGPEANTESRLRISAYRSVLQEFGLPFEESMLVTGDFRMPSGAQAVRRLTKSYGTSLDRLDAIVAANDNMAIGALDELRALHIQVSERLIVAGFDDAEEARLTDPSLTTSRQPLERIGREAVRRVLQARSESEDLELRIKTELVVRQSCGCSAPALVGRAATGSNERFLSALMAQRGRIEAQIGRAARGRFSAAGHGWEQSLIGTLMDDLISGKPQRFLPAAERLIQRLAGARVDLNAVDEVVSALREELAPLLQGAPDKYWLTEDLLHAVRLSTSAALQRGLGRVHLEFTRWAHRIAGACNSIAAATDYDELRARVNKVVEQLGVASCFVSVYDKPGDPKQARLLVSSGADGIDVSADSFQGQELLPPELASIDGGGRSFAVLPLLGRREVLGHVLIQYTAQHAFTCGVLAEALSIAITNITASQGAT